MLQGDRSKLLELLTNYELPISGHEGYPKVIKLHSVFFVSSG